ncbi:unnamed protein product, partial [Closterium sp. NIES-54]
VAGRCVWCGAEVMPPPAPNFAASPSKSLSSWGTVVTWAAAAAVVAATYPQEQVVYAAVVAAEASLVAAAAAPVAAPGHGLVR